MTRRRASTVEAASVANASNAAVVRFEADASPVAPATPASTAAGPPMTRLVPRQILACSN